MRRPQILPILLGTFAVALLPLTDALAQGAGFTAPLDAMDELSGAPVGGGGAVVGTGAIDRARGVAQPGQQQQPGFQPGMPGMMMDPGMEGEFGMMGFGYGMQQQQQQAYVPPATVRAWGGERVIQYHPDPDVAIHDYLDDDILADAREIRILQTAEGSYPNVVTVGTDEIRQNINLRRDYISPEAHVVRTRLVQTLRYMSMLNPREFTFVRVATTEPLSPLPKMIDLEAEQDERLTQWMEDFMAPFVLPREEGEEYELVPSFLAPPPRAPNLPLPSNFRPETEAQEEQEGGQPGMMGGAGPGFEPGFEGGPMGGASSRYF